MQHSALAGRPLGAANVARLGASVPAGRAFTAVQASVADTRKARVIERHRRLRNKLSGSEERPRLAVFRSNQHIYAQVIDDTAANGVGATLAAASTLQKDIKTALEGSTANKSAAEAVGKKIAELCLAKNITKVAFDRGGFLYHGRVQAVAEAARAAGLSF